MTVSEYNDCVKIHADDVYRFAYKSVRNEADAKDVVQQCFEVLWEKRQDVVLEKSKSYLFTIAHRKSIDLFRSNRRWTEFEVIDENDIFSKPTNHGLKKELENALHTLSQEQRNLVVLKDIEGYSYEEIADITQLSLSQVKVYLFRARKELQKLLQVYKYHI